MTVSSTRKPVDPERLDRLSLATGIGAFVVVVLSIYGANRLLSWLVGPFWAEAVLALPAFFAFVSIFWTADKSRSAIARWLCHRQGGHRYLPYEGVRDFERCEYCDDVRFSAQPAAGPIP
jgi:hypothetical protein